MLRVLKSELYATVHSRWFWLFVAGMLIFSLLATNVAVANRKTGAIVYIFLAEQPDAELEEFVDFVAEEYGEGSTMALYSENWGGYMISAAMHEKLSPGGDLAERYGHLLERDDFFHGRAFSRDERYGMDDYLFFEKWAVTGIAGDAAASSFTAIFFSVFFFGRARSRRYYTANALNGIRRHEMLLGRVFAFALIGVLMGAAQFVLCYCVLAPGVFELYGWAVMLRLLAARLVFDLTAYGFMITFAVLIKNRVIAFFVNLFTLYFSAELFVRAGLSEVSYVGMMRATLDCAETGVGFGGAYLGQFAWLGGVLAVSLAVSWLYFRRAELK